MHATHHTHHALPQHRHPPWLTPAQTPAPGAGATGAGTDASFVALLDGYRHSGGLARAGEVSRMLDGPSGPGTASLARWLAQRCVISFEWQAQTWLPRFQFLPAGPLPAEAVAAVLLELNPVFDSWEVAQWFAQPHSALGELLPVDVLDADPGAVLHAARRDRYIAKG